MKDYLEGIPLDELDKYGKMFMVLFNKLVQKGILTESEVGEMVKRCKEHE